MATFRLAQALALNAHEAGSALDRLLADTRHGPVSTIVVPGECQYRMIRRRDRAERLECVMTWEPIGTGCCSFLGSLHITECGRGPLALILDGLPELHDRAQREDERLGRERAEFTGRAVLEWIAAELYSRNALLAAPSRKLAERTIQLSIARTA